MAKRKYKKKPKKRYSLLDIINVVFFTIIIMIILFAARMSNYEIDKIVFEIKETYNLIKQQIWTQ